MTTAFFDPTPQVLFSRYEDGALPVIKTLPGTWTTTGHDGHTSIFSTAKALLAHLTGHPTGRNWTTSRYFRTNVPVVPAESDVTVLFGMSEIIVPVLPLAPGLIDVFGVNASSVKASSIVRSRPKTGLGIDLKRRSDEVRKLFFAGFGAKAVRMGFEPEDVLQEVYKGLLTRNEGICPFDQSKSSFGHYVHMVAGCIFSNYRRKQSRVRELEQLGMTGTDDKDTVSTDAGTWASDHMKAPVLMMEADRDLDDVQMDLVKHVEDMGDPDAVLMGRALNLMRRGYGRKEIALRTGVSRTVLARAVKSLKIHATQWVTGA